jgi:hypothetical protein
MPKAGNCILKCVPCLLRYLVNANICSSHTDDEIVEAMDDVTDECVNDHELPPNEAEGTVRLSSRST